MPVTPRAMPFALALCALCPPTPTQSAPSAWASLTPPGGIDPTAVSVSDKLLLYRVGNYLRVFSAVTGRWHPFSPSFGTTPLLGEEFLMVPEGDRLTGFSAYRGVFEPLLLQNTAGTLSTSRSLLVLEQANVVHVFSAFTGRWHSHPVPAGWRMRLAERIVTFGDYSGTSSFGGAIVLDAYTGQWHSLAARAEPRPRTSVNGGTAMFAFNSEVLGFSNQRPTFATSPPAPLPQGGLTTSARGGDLVGTRGTTFSGITGVFAALPYTQQQTSIGNSPFFDALGVVGKASLAFQPGYALGLNGQWVPRLAGRSFGSGGSILLAIDGNQVQAFSAITGTVAVLSGANTPLGVFDLDDHVALTTNGTTGLVTFYSGLTGQVYAAPPGISPGPFVTLGSAGAVVSTTTGITAFSARSGTFHPLVGSGLNLIRGASAALGAWDGTTLYAFDAVKEQWTQTPLQTTLAPIVSTRGSTSSTMIGRAPQRLVGFGARTGRLQPLPVSEPVLDTQVRGDLAFARTTTTLHAFGGFGDNVPWSGFPEDLVGCGIGSDLHHQLRLPQGGLALMGFGPRAASPLAIPSLGEVWLEPALADLRFVAPDAGEDRAVLQLPVPNIAALRNSEWFLQSLITRPGRSPYVSDPVAFRIL